MQIIQRRRALQGAPAEPTEERHMIILDEYRLKLKDYRKDAEELGSIIGADALRQRLSQIEQQASSPDFWNDSAKSKQVLAEQKSIKDTLGEYDRLMSDIDDAETLVELASEEGDDSLDGDIVATVGRISSELQKQRLETLLSGEYDKNNAILSLHAGAGGTEAQDWAQMLYRMYCRYAEKNGFKVKTLDYLEGDEAGIKSASVLIEGSNAYGFLKSETGIHRLVRVSPFNAAGKRQTSFASVEVMPDIEDDSGQVQIRDEDITVEAHRASGAGGQHINKTDSAIRIIHHPTGIVVGCQNERSQKQNKEMAMRMLRSKLIEIKEREHLEKIEDIKGDQKEIGWGSQIRSYVFMPYTLVKDLRTGYEVGNVNAVMDGDLNGFIDAYLKQNRENRP